MHWAEHSKRLGVFMGIMLSTVGIGTVFAGYAYSHVLEAWGWRVASLWAAAALLIITVLFGRDVVRSGQGADQGTPAQSAV